MAGTPCIVTIGRALGTGRLLAGDGVEVAGSGVPVTGSTTPTSR